jgi:hypothetical protein
MSESCAAREFGLNTQILKWWGACLALTVGLTACGGGQDQAERRLSVDASSSGQRLKETSPQSSATQGSGSAATEPGESAWRASGQADSSKRGEPNPNIPANLWQPPEGATPTHGSYVYLESDPSDDIGRGVTRLYTPANAVLSARHGSRYGQGGQGAFLGISVKGDQQWEGDFQVSQLLSEVQMGHYVRLKQYPRHDPVFGGLSWSTEGRSCKMSSGWVAVDNIYLNSYELRQVELRFEQVCHDSQGRLRGKVRWDISESTPHMVPVSPVPAGVWSPPNGTLPATGNALYIESDRQDFMAQGRSFLLTTDDTSMFHVGVSADPANLFFWIQGQGQSAWMGYFKPVIYRTRLEPGLYPNLPDYINAFLPGYGGFDLTGLGTNCHTSNSWLAIDNVSYDGDRLTSLDMRFEQFCWNEGEGLRGALRWTAPTVN